MKSISRNSKLAVLALLSGGLPLLGSLGARYVWGDIPHIQEPLHSAVELAGTFIALGVAMLLLLRLRHDPSSRHLFWVAAALIAMGLVDGLHAVYGISLRSWQRHGATFLGGILFALVWVPLRPARVWRQRLWIFALVGLALALGAWWGSGMMPVTWDPVGLYVFPVKAANALGGLGFLAAALFFGRRYLKHAHPEDLVFACHTVLFGVASLLFGLSHTWAADWWVWHAFRLLAYIVVLIAANEMLAALYRRIGDQAQGLEARVQAGKSELRDSEERFRSAVESAPEAIFIQTRRCFAYANPMALRLFGADTEARLLGLPVLERFHPDQRSQVDARIRRLNEDRMAVPSVEETILRLDNTQVDVEVSAVPFVFGGEPGALVFIHDITQRRQTEAEIKRRGEEQARLNVELTRANRASLNLMQDAVLAKKGLEKANRELQAEIAERRRVGDQLKETNEYLDTLFNYANAPIIVWNPEFRITRFNRAFEMLTGRAADDVLGQSLEILFPPSAVRDSMALIKRTQTGERWESVEIPVLNLDGSVRTVLWNSATIFGPGEKTALAAIAQGQDITERKKAEAALLESEEKFREMVETLPLAIYLSVGIEQKCEYLNPMFIKMFGYTLEDIPTVAEWWPLAYPDEEYRKGIADEWTRRVKIALNTQSPIEPMEVVVTGKDGSKKTVSWGYITLGEKNYAFGTDLTGRKQAEAEVVRAMRDLERSNKDLEQFAYVASHDLQEPLRMISSYTQLLAKRYGDRLDEKAKTYIDYAVDGAARMQRLINDLLMFSRVGTRGKRPEPVDAHAVFEAALRNLEAAIAENAAVVTAGVLPVLRADASQLLQVFQNLVANSLKFRGEAPPLIHVAAEDQGGEWRFSVKDNGIGIDPQFADKLFVVFRRLHTRQEYPGTGIGLALCKKIVERHGGRIWFESAPAQGATFFFTIPK